MLVFRWAIMNDLSLFKMFSFHSAFYDNKDSACGNLMGFQQLHQFVYMRSAIWRQIDGAKHISIVFLLALLR